MKNYLFIFCVLSLLSFGQVKNELGTPLTITFQDENYDLSFASKPSEGFYKQQFIQKEDQTQRYRKAIFIDLILDGELSPEFAIDHQQKYLEEAKKSIPEIQWRYERKGDEYILDFLTFGYENQENIAEHGVYRFLPFTSKKGQKGVMIFSFSHRAYNKEIFFFVKNTSNTEGHEISKAFKQLPVPSINL